MERAKLPLMVHNATILAYFDQTIERQPPIGICRSLLCKLGMAKSIGTLNRRCRSRMSLLPERGVRVLCAQLPVTGLITQTKTIFEKRIIVLIADIDRNLGH